jgi:hypothetical protein
MGSKGTVNSSLKVQIFSVTQWELSLNVSFIVCGPYHYTLHMSAEVLLQIQKVTLFNASSLLWEKFEEATCKGPNEICFSPSLIKHRTMIIYGVMVVQLAGHGNRVVWGTNAGIVRSNPTRDMDVCVRLFSVCVVLLVGSGLETGWSLVQGVLLKKRPGPNKGA